jgi:hypothetical protein
MWMLIKIATEVIDLFLFNTINFIMLNSNDLNNG